jgi:hypothetical protein
LIENLRKIYEKISKDEIIESPESLSKFIEEYNSLENKPIKLENQFYIFFRAIFDINIAHQIIKNSALIQHFIDVNILI